MSVSKQLAKVFGGHWRFDGVSRWLCDDGRRYVVKQCSGLSEFGDPVSSQLVMYDHEGNPVCVATAKLLAASSARPPL